MVMAIYKRALSVLMKKPVRLWGISLLGALLAGLASAAFGLIPVVGLAVGILFDVSLTMILLRGYRGDFEPKAVDLFDTFKDWKTIKRVLCGMGWMVLWIFLWSLIPVVGIVFGIIRTYEYRLTPYILMEEPDVKPADAIKLSKERTKGWKGKMFWADVLVYVLFFVAILILGLLGRIPYLGILFKIVMAVLYIVFMLLIGLFIGLVQAAFYEEIRKWGTYPGKQAYVTPKQPAGPAPGAYPPPGYDPQQQQQPYYAPPQGYDPQQSYPPQQPGYPPQQPAYPPQQPAYPPQQPAYPPQQPAYQPPEGFTPPAQNIPQPNFPQGEPPVYPQVDFPPQPEAPQPPQPPQE